MGEKLIGRTLLNQFRVDSFVASGGMGAVYRVWDLQRSVPLAMKVLHSDLADDPTLLRRFKREARALQKLTHPHIVPFYGLFEIDDTVFLLERFVEGATLKEVLRRRKGRPFSPEEALPVLNALCSALGYAHANGVVHCDVKPGNVMVEDNGSIYLTDFGVVRHAESTTTTLAGAGTPAYMAPEQIRGEAVGPATDVYALGVVLFELLTGVRPFRGKDGDSSGGITAGEQIRQAHLTQPPPDPRSLNPSLPPELAALVSKCLAKQPEGRYPNMRALFWDACRCVGLAPEAVADRMALPPPDRENWQAGPSLEAAHSASRLPARRKGPLVWGFGAAAFVVCAALVVVGIVTSRQLGVSLDLFNKPGPQLLAGQSSGGPPTLSTATLAGGAQPVEGAEPMAQKAPEEPAPTPTFGISFPTRTPTQPMPLTRTPRPTNTTRPTSAYVLWDSSRGPRISQNNVPPIYDPTGLYGNLVDGMASESIFIENNTRYMPGLDLSAYQAVVINHWSGVDTPITRNEVDDLFRYVQDGGGLLIMAESEAAGGQLAELCQRFGVRCYLSPNITGASSFTSHPVTRSIGELIFGYEGGALGAKSASTIVGLGNSSPAVVTLEHGGGRVVILSDSNLFDNNFLNQADNYNFAVNIFRWITGLDH